MKGILGNSTFNPDVKTTPVTQLYKSVVLICHQTKINNGDYSERVEVGSGFLIDNIFGLVVTSQHTFQKVISAEDRIFVFYPRNIKSDLEKTDNNISPLNNGSRYGTSIDFKGLPDVYEAAYRHEARIVPTGQFDHTVLDACILRIVNFESLECLPKLRLTESFEPGETVRILGYRQEALRSHIEGCLNYVLDFSKGTYVTRYDLPQDKNGSRDRIYMGAEITVDCNSFRGYSGGPAVNAKGDVIGIVRGFYYEDRPEFDYGLGTLVPSSDIKSLVEKARAYFVPSDY